MSQESLDTRWLRRLLSAIVVLLAIIAVELSVLVLPMEPRAVAQIPDSGMQRKEMIDAISRGNTATEKILDHLRTQSIKVKVLSTDKDNKPATAPKPPSERK